MKYALLALVPWSLIGILSIRFFYAATKRKAPRPSPRPAISLEKLREAEGSGLEFIN